MRLHLNVSDGKPWHISIFFACKIPTKKAAIKILQLSKKK